MTELTKNAEPAEGAVEPAEGAVEPAEGAVEPAEGAVEPAGDAPDSRGEAAPRGRVLKVHDLRPARGARKPKTRVGRGEGSKGKTAGRGTKGSKARKQVPARFEGGQMPLHMRVPKLKGFRNRFRVEYEVVNLARLGELFPDGGEVGVGALVARGAVRPKAPVKVLGDGEIGVALHVTANAFSAAAKTKIEAAGGSVTRL
jgi:large subunit ribosomal protein L15